MSTRARKSPLENIKIGYSALTKSIRLYRMGKDPRDALETRDATHEAISVLAELLLGQPNKSTGFTAKHSDLGAGRFELSLKFIPQPDTGTLVHASYRARDLLPAFYEELERLEPGKALAVVQEHLHDEDAELVSVIEIAGRKAWGEISDEVWDRLETREVVDCLMHELDVKGQEHGLYFGAHEGDGSDYGFWENPAEEQS